MHHVMPRKSPILLVAAVCASAALAAPAGAQTPADIEGVWSFNGGQVAVQPLPDGTFEGTIIRPTRLAECPHPVGEKMWVGVRPVGDGSYTGGHQWFDPSNCTYRPTRGNSVFRVLAKPDGTRFLRACFSPPERPTEQPTMTPDGVHTPSSINCFDSDLLSPLPVAKPSVGQITNLPPATKRKECRSRRSFKIRLREPKGDALASATISLNGKRIGTRRGARITAPVNLKGLPKGRYTVRIKATTVLGNKISGSRTYRTCTPKEKRKLKGRI